MPALLRRDRYDLVPDRRRAQFMNDPGYYVFPMPYSTRVGEGLGVIGIG